MVLSGESQFEDIELILRRADASRGRSFIALFLSLSVVSTLTRDATGFRLGKKYTNS